MKILVKTDSANLREILDYAENSAVKDWFYWRIALGYNDLTLYNHWTQTIYVQIWTDSIVWEWLTVEQGQWISDYMRNDTDWNLVSETSNNDSVSVILNAR